jgi:hypothetical protein
MNIRASFLKGLLIISAGCLFDPAEGMTEAELNAVIAKLEMSHYFSKEEQAIVDAQKAKNPELVVKLSTELIARSPESFETVQFGYYLKSLAYDYRSRALQEMHRPFWRSFEDQKRGADLGNRDAMMVLGHLYVDPDVQKMAEKGEVKFDTAEVRKYLLGGAELGDSFCALRIGFGDVSVGANNEERIYWALAGLIRDKTTEKKYKIEMINQICKEFDIDQIDSALQKYSLVGGRLPAGPFGLPARGLEATLMIDEGLRWTYGHGFGAKAPDTVPEAPTTSEMWEFQKAMNERMGFVRPFLLVPGSRKFDDPDIISLPLDSIMGEIQPGDHVFVRSGPLSHVAIVYEVDRKSGTIGFADVAYQFWQKDYNAAVKSFVLEERSYHRYLAVVSMKEVSEMLEAVITFRDPPAATGK